MLLTSSLKATISIVDLIGAASAVSFGQDDCTPNPWIYATHTAKVGSYLTVDGFQFNNGISFGAKFCAMKVQHGKLLKDWLVNSLHFWTAADYSRIDAIQISYTNGEMTDVIGTPGEGALQNTVKWDPATEYVDFMGGYGDIEEGNVKSLAVTVHAIGRDKYKYETTVAGLPFVGKPTSGTLGTVVGLVGKTGSNGVELLSFYMLPQTCFTDAEPDRKDCNG